MAMLVNKEAEFTLLVAGVYCDGFSVGKGGCYATFTHNLEGIFAG